jgi:hypothetical protein
MKMNTKKERENMEWKPTNEDIELAKKDLENIAPNGVWYSPDQNLHYRRDEDKERIILVNQLDHPVAEEQHRRVKAVCEAVGWEMHDEDVEMIDAAAPNPEEAQYAMRLQLQQELARATCTNEGCETHLVAMPLEEVKWTHLRNSEHITPDGEEITEEVWSALVICPDCGEEVHIFPNHYFMMAGDELSMQWVNEKGIKYSVLEKEEVISMIDAEVDGVLILGTFCPFTQEVVPPQYRGLIMKFEIGEEEE